MKQVIAYITTHAENAVPMAPLLDAYTFCPHVVAADLVKTLEGECPAADLCVLDIGNQLEDPKVLKSVAAVTKESPILALFQGRCDIDAPLAALIRQFSHGKVDILTMPFSHEALKDKVSDCLRRNNGSSKTDVTLDFDSQHLHIQGVSIPVTRMEFSMLKCLLTPVGRICTRDLLIERLHQHDLNVTDRSIDQHIKNLRKKLNEAGIPGGDVIKSVYGVGYQFVDQ